MTKSSILVIDDSSEMLFLQRSVLESAGYDVFTAESGAEALEILSKIDDPGLIILDLQMEDMDGVEFLKILEENKPEIIETVPVIFLSGKEAPPPSKAVGFIKKFPDIDDFLATVNHFIKVGMERPDPFVDGVVPYRS